MSGKTICTTCLRLKQGYCDGEKELTACPSYKRMTNGDRIRAMTDEEMADELSYPGCHKQSTPEICREHTGNCKQCWLDWLKQEVSDNG